MNTKQLIEKLKEFDPDTKVIISYGKPDDIHDIKKVEIRYVEHIETGEQMNAVLIS